MVNRSTGAGMALMRNKKGLFFTIVTIVTLSLFLVTYGIYNEFKARSSEQKRVETLDNFLKAIEADLERQIYIMGFRAIFIIENKITEQGSYSSNVPNKISEIILNGTLDGIEQSLMIEATLPEIVAATNEKALKVNAELNLSQPLISTFQRDPWHIIVQMNTTLVLRDRNGKARWTLNKSIEAKINIENFEDPLFLVGTNGIITNKITKTVYTPFTQGMNVENVLAHTTGSFYTETVLAPSFLNRLEGNLTPSSYGIESLVNLQELSGAGMTIQDKSAVDHIYFSVQNPSSHRIQGMPSWFKIDNAHLVTYGVENLTI